MRLREYVPLEISRLTARIRGHLQEGNEAGALVRLQMMLTMLASVLDGDTCPPVAPPASVGHPRWDALIYGALVTLSHQPQWPAPEPLPEPWFPLDEQGADREVVLRETPAELAAVNIFIRAKDLRRE